MPTPFLLDTNAYYRFFQNPKARTAIEEDAYNRLSEKIIAETIKSFYISEITSMEIHSVLGNYRRGIPSQKEKCTRKIVIAERTGECEHFWLTKGTRKMPLKWFQDVQKMTSDIEAKRGDLQATILSLNEASIQTARTLLMQYAPIHNFGSHDALIAGSLVTKKREGLDLTLVTSDKIFKKVLEKANINFYDPFIP